MVIQVADILQAKLPWLLTVLHTGSTFVGCSLLLASGQLKLSRLGTKENLILVAFSTLFTLNIAISNVSLSVFIVQQCVFNLANMISVRLYLYPFIKSCDLHVLLRLLSSTALLTDDHTPATPISQ